MDECNVVADQTKKTPFWEKVVSVMSEPRRREIAIAELIMRPKISKEPGPKVESDRTTLTDAIIERQDNTVESVNDDKLRDELEFIKKVWEMRTNSKL